jgi:ribonuclease HII
MFRPRRGRGRRLDVMAFRIGVDENGLGPRLGPMIVTAVMAEVTEEGAKIAGKKARGRLAEVLGDSKAMVAHGDVSLGEAWARALARRGCGRDAAGDARSIDDLIHGFAIDDATELRRFCSKHGESMCWSTRRERFESDGGAVAELEGHLDRLAKKGVVVRSVRSVVVCTKRLNDAFDARRSRFVVDLHAMERLVLALREQAGADVDAVCGKVGGIGSYEDFFGPLAGRLYMELERSRKRSAYHFPGVGQVAFVVDADDSDLLVGLASMVGKWLREVLMGRIARNLAGKDAAVSGYYNAKTTQFIEATALLRARRKIPDDCFDRKTLAGGDVAVGEASSQGPGIEAVPLRA